jgi:hypothetical protein
MLFIRHFSTFIFSSLIFGSMAEQLMPGRIYAAHYRDVLPDVTHLVHVFSVILENEY